MEKAYAQALWQMVERGTEPKKAVDALHEKLKSLGREALMPRIGKEFERIAQRAHRRNTMTLTVADKKHEHAAVKEAMAALKLAKDDVEVLIDDSLIGGWRLEGRERLIDASYKKYLLDMYNRAVS